MNQPRIDRRLRISGVLLILGLAVEATSLLWVHPTAFLVFLLVGGVAMAAGIVLHLCSLLPAGPLWLTKITKNRG